MGGGGQFKPSLGYTNGQEHGSLVESACCISLGAEFSQSFYNEGVEPALEGWPLTSVCGGTQGSLTLSKPPLCHLNTEIISTHIWFLRGTGDTNSDPHAYTAAFY